MPVSMCRVTVHCGGASTDVTLPATVAVAELIPPVADLLGSPAQGCHWLSRLGCAPLPSSTTLAQNGVRDGTLLVLSSQDPRPPVSRCDDDAETVAAALTSVSDPHGRTGRVIGAAAALGFAVVGAITLARSAFSDPRTPGAVPTAVGALVALAAASVSHRAGGDPVAGLTLSIIAAVFAALTGLLAVPGAPGAPQVLLAAMAAAATTLVAICLTRSNAVVVGSLTCGAGIIAVAALASATTAAPPLVVGSLTAPVCLGLIEAAPRVSIVAAGLSPIRTRPEAEVAVRARHADAWLTCLRTGFATTAAGGASVAALAAHRGLALVAVTGGVLLLHARTDRKRAVMFAVTGIGTLTTGLAIAGTTAGHGHWLLALTAILIAASIYLGFLAPAVTLSPVARRGADALGCVALAAVIPLAGWTCGAFSAIRALSLQP